MKNENQINYNWKDKTILLIDSPNKNNFWLKDFINDTEVNLILETDWINSVKLCRINKSIDLVIVDIESQPIVGFEAIRQIFEFNDELPIIGLLDSESIHKYTNQKFIKFILKPIRMTEFYSTVETIFSNK